MIRRFALLIVLSCLFSAPAFAQTGSNDIYCPVSGVPLWGPLDGPAQLPVACYNTASVNTPASGSVVNVAANNTTDFQNKLNAAVCGQRITLPAGSVYSPVTIPSIACTAGNYLWIVSSGLSSLPAEGARYTTTYNSETAYLPQFGPCYAGVTSLLGRPAFNCPGTPGTYTAQILTNGPGPGITFSANTSCVRFIGIEVTRVAGTHIVFGLVSSNAGNVDHIIFDRCWIHGDEQLGGGGDETENGINSSAVSYLAVIDSYLNDFYCVAVSGTCSDSHAVDGGLNGVNTTPETVTKIVNNFMEAAAETMIFGGGPANTTPNDFEIRLDCFFKPLQWNPGDPSYNGGVIITTHPAEPVIVKNLFELKNNNRALLEGIQGFNNWAGFSQGGEGFLIAAKNDTGNLCPNCTVSNITVRYSWLNTVAAAFDIALGPASDGNYAFGTWNISHHDLVADNVVYPNCYQCVATLTEEVFITNGPAAPQQIHDISMNHVTVVLSSSAPYVPSGMLGISGQNSPQEIFGIAFTNNLMLTAQQGTFNHADSCPTNNCACSTTGGITMINACWKGPTGSGTYAFAGNCIIGTPVKTWPSGNVTSIASYSVALVSYNNGNAGDYTVAPGACKGIATDGTDPGANLPLVAAVLAGQPVFGVPVTRWGVIF